MDIEPAAEKRTCENTTSKKTASETTTAAKKTTSENTTSKESKMDVGNPSDEEKSGNDDKLEASTVEPIADSEQKGNSKKQRKRKRKKDNEKSVVEGETESAPTKRNCVENITNPVTVVNPTVTSTSQKQKKKKKKGPKKAITA
jgi:hypothetical protein